MSFDSKWTTAQRRIKLFTSNKGHKEIIPEKHQGDYARKGFEKKREVAHYFVFTFNLKT
jgi:uncharacterized protein YktA (UPF0223 family)